MNPQRRPGLEALDEAYTRLRARRRPARHPERFSQRRTPWGVLHITCDAPGDVLDAAYGYWKSHHTPGARVLNLPSNLARSLLWLLRSPALLLNMRRPRQAKRRAATAALVSGGNEVTPNGGSNGSAAVLLVPETAPGRPLAINERPLRIGSEPEFEVVVPDPLAAVARIEARIWYQDGRSFLHAVSGGEAILVNNEPLTWAVLEDGDRVRVGRATFTFRAAAAPFS
jgi:hypothetical protein